MKEPKKQKKSESVQVVGTNKSYKKLHLLVYWLYERGSLVHLPVLLLYSSE